MSTIKDGGLAFPAHPEIGMPDRMGMTLREYFAAKAMQGMLAVPDNQRYGDRADQSLTIEQWQRWCVTGMVEHAYRIADAMLRARDQEPS